MDKSVNASHASYFASLLTAVAGTLSTQELVAISGLALAACTFGLNWYYKHKHYQLVRRRAMIAEAEDMGESDV
jgi:hypothetical protein